MIDIRNYKELLEVLVVFIYINDSSWIGSNDKGSNSRWPPGWLHTLGAGGRCPYLTGIGFLCGLKFFALNIFWGEYLQPRLCLILQICKKINTVKDMPISNYEFLNMQDCSFHVFWNGVQPISCGKLQVMSRSLISTGASGYIQDIVWLTSQIREHRHVCSNIIGISLADMSKKNQPRQIIAHERCNQHGIFILVLLILRLSQKFALCHYNTIPEIFPRLCVCFSVSLFMGRYFSDLFTRIYKKFQ